MTGDIMGMTHEDIAQMTREGDHLALSLMFVLSQGSTVAVLW